MHVASLALCQELKALSGWTDTYFQWRTHPSGEAYVVGHVPDADPLKEETPAYDLGYLVRRLPRKLDGEQFMCEIAIEAAVFGEGWCAGYLYHTTPTLEAETPEDAATKLAIELFKQGVLTRGGDE